jgi:hypothetical protein
MATVLAGDGVRARPANSSTWVGDLALAVGLALALAGLWALQGWSDLAALRLGDTDDMMRLQQVRDWLSGQAWGDLHQYRLGPPGGLAMHWSRLADLPIATVILLLSPLIGVHAAEVAAVTLIPPLYLVAHLMLTTAIARQLGGELIARTAMIVAALAYPAVNQFMPGRIDHHALQMVMLMAGLHGMIAPVRRWRAVATGAALFASLAVGFEMLPLLAILGGWAALTWILGQKGADTRLGWIGVGLAACGVIGAALVPGSAPAGLCDALDPSLRMAVVAAGLGAAAIVATGARSILARSALVLLLGLSLAALLVSGSPACLDGPYGATDPTLKRLWLGNVSEALPLWELRPGYIVSFASLMTVGLLATGLQVRRSGAGWWGLLALLGAALAITCIQLRAANAGAALAVPGIAALIAMARVRGLLPLTAAWIFGAGITYPLLGGLIEGPREDSALTATDCTGPSQLVALGKLPAGRIAAPIDIGAFAIAATSHTSLSAPYHRNNSGNLAMYRFFLAPETEAHAIATRFHVDYAAWCPGAMSELKLDSEAAPDALARRLPAGRAPAWLRLVKRDGLQVWRVEPAAAQ